MSAQMLNLDGLLVDLQRRSIRSPDGPADRLTTLEANVLAYLAAHTDRVVDRAELLTEVWGYSPATVSRACDNTIRRLRVKIEANPGEPERLLTVHGTGYRLLVGPAVPATAPPPTAPRRSVRLGDRRIDLDSGRIDGPDGCSTLTHKETAVLSALYDADGQSVDRGTLLRRVWASTAGRPLDSAILRLRRKIEPDPARPRYVLTTTTGYRLDRERASRLAAPTPAGHLPLDLDAMFGRRDEIAHVAERFAAGDRWIVLVGPGGVGKTRLAAAAAREITSRTGRAGWWVPLGGVATEVGVYPALARTLGLSLVGDDPVGPVLRALAHVGPALVVLDNLDQLATDATVTVVESLLEHAPELHLLGTSRVLPRLRGQRRIEVGPLPPPDAIALFTERAIRPPAPDELADVATLVTALEGVPLAIELAAASTRTLRVAQIHRRVHLDPSLVATVARSWDLVSPTARAALAALSVFRGGFTLDAAERVLDLGGVDGVDAIDVIEELVDASLVRIEPDGARFGMFDVIARFAADRLSDEARIAAETRHGAAFARWPDLDRPDEIERRTALARELDNLVAACRRAVARADAEVAGTSAVAAWAVLELAGPYPLAVELLRAAVALPGVDDRVRTAAARAFVRVGDLDRAEAELAGSTDPYGLLELAALYQVRNRTGGRPLADEALATAIRTRDVALECQAHLQIGREAHLARADGLGRWSVEAALHLAQAIGAPRLIGRVHEELALSLRDLCELDAAERHADTARSIARDVGDRRLEAEAILLLSNIAGLRHEPLVRLDWTEASLAISRAIGDRRGEAIALNNLAGVLVRLGRYEEADAQNDRARRLARELGANDLELHVVSVASLIAHRRGRTAEGERLLREGIALARAHSPAHEGMMWTNLGDRLVDRPAESWRAYERALALHAEVRNHSGTAHALASMAQFAFATGEQIRARAIGLEALASARALGLRQLEADALGTLARVALALGEPEVGLPYALAAEELRRRAGNPDELAEAMRLADALGARR